MEAVIWIGIYVADKALAILNKNVQLNWKGLLESIWLE
jgi:hypothetical protein